MTLPVVLCAEAKKDLSQALDWYEKNIPGKSAKLVERVQEDLDRIAETPEMHAVVFKNIRKKVVKRFPYNIYYHVEENRIVVIAIFHHKRNPKTWMKRARNNGD